jgi:hypothetical protein
VRCKNSDVVFELLHEVKRLDCRSLKLQAVTFPECSYLRTLAKVVAGHSMKPATFFKRFLSDGIELYLDSENEYNLIKILDSHIAGTPLEAAGVTHEQLTAARKTLRELNKRVADVLAW